ncbi:MAG: hypothetical protein Q7K55_02980, partial [Candidatus Levybacteria bacterium]|nr:hypothetical protein [Candidatus Levybacteria bacterium]
NQDIVDIVTSFQRKISENKPSDDRMYDEVRMMHFKIKPLQGDISILNLKNNQFIEILWSLGKLDEFFQDQYRKISPRDRRIFMKIFNEIHEKFQKQLNSLNLKPERNIDTSQGFEMEIFKEKTRKKN